MRQARRGRLSAAHAIESYFVLIVPDAVPSVTLPANILFWKVWRVPGAVKLIAVPFPARTELLRNTFAPDPFEPMPAELFEMIVRSIISRRIAPPETAPTPPVLLEARLSLSVTLIAP